MAASLPGLPRSKCYVMQVQCNAYVFAINVSVAIIIEC